MFCVFFSVFLYVLCFSVRTSRCLRHSSMSPGDANVNVPGENSPEAKALVSPDGVSAVQRWAVSGPVTTQTPVSFSIVPRQSA